MNSKDLAEILRKQDIYIAASRSESCSNSLLEAINCGLVVAARDSGCYREVIKGGGIIASDAKELLEQLDILRNCIEEYQKDLPYYDIEEIGKAYYTFITEVGEALAFKKQERKELTQWQIREWKLFVFAIKIKDKLERIWNRLCRR